MTTETATMEQRAARLDAAQPVRRCIDPVGETPYNRSIPDNEIVPSRGTSGQTLLAGGSPMTLPLLGFNVQPGPWTSADYKRMAGRGAKIIRTVIFWDDIWDNAYGPPRSSTDIGGVIPSYITSLTNHVNQCSLHGMYTTFNFYFGPQGKHMPPCMETVYNPVNNPKYTGSEIGNYIANGQSITQYLASLYKNYNAVIGFELNEVTPNPGNGDNWAVDLYQQQNDSMISWFMQEAPGWIAIISPGYGASAPYANAPGSGHNGDQKFHTPDPSIFTSTKQIMLDFHDYMRGLISGKTGFDGRNSEGMDDDSQIIKIDNPKYTTYPAKNPSPNPRLTRGRSRSEFEAYKAPFDAWCAPDKANCPLMIGESGFIPGKTYTGPVTMAEDKLAAWGAHGPYVIAMQWDYNISSANDPWSAFSSSGGPGYAKSNHWQLWTNTLFG